MASGCAICRRMERTTPQDANFVAELETGYTVLADNQQIPGYTIFICKTCVPELHELAPDVRQRFLDEMALVAEAVFRAFEPRKLNYELLGNSVAHLHWHLIPRYADDPDPLWPVWRNEEWMKAGENPQPDPAALRQAGERLRATLSRLRA